MQSYPKKSIFIIIPAINEEKHIGKVVVTAKKYLPNIVVVDDGSTDDTRKVAAHFGAIVIAHDKNLGKGAALHTGSDYAFKNGAKAVIFVDADGQHNPAEIPLFVKSLSSGVQVVFGVRWLDAEMPLARLVGNKMASVVINLLFKVFIPDIPSGYKAMTKAAYKKIDWQSKRYEVETEIACKVGLYRIPFAFVPIETIYHHEQTDVMQFSDTLKVAGKVLIWRLIHPSRWK